MHCSWFLQPNGQRVSCLPPFRTNVHFPPTPHPHPPKRKLKLAALPLFLHISILSNVKATAFSPKGEKEEVGGEKRTHLVLPSSRRLSSLTSQQRHSVPRGVMATSALPPNPPHVLPAPRHFPTLNPTTPTCIIDGAVMAPLKQDGNLVDVLTTVGAGRRVGITRSTRGQLRTDLGAGAG